MTEVATLITAIAGGALASLAGSYIKRVFKRAERVTWRVSSPRGRQEEITVSQSPVGGADLVAQQAISKALDAMYHHPTERGKEDLQALVSQMNTYLPSAPLSRQLHIVLGNAYRNLGQFEKAIEVVSRFINNKELASQRDADLAAAYYNRACYLALSGQTEGALPDLKKSLDLAPSYVSKALEDPDLAALHSYIR